MIDKQNPLPYYAQVKEIIYGWIREGKWRPGQQLPGELELCNLLGVSRTVIRQAFNELVHEGVIRREKGRGTFVAQTRVRESLVQRLTGFFQDMTEQGFRPVSQVLQQTQIPASSTIAEHLKIAQSTPVILIERLRFVSGEPLVLVSTYLPYQLCPDLLREDLTNQSLYAFLETRYGLVIAHGRRTITAVAADNQKARLLKVKPGAPLLQLKSVSYLSDGTPLEYYHALHRADRSQFEVELVSVKSNVVPHVLRDN